MRFFRDLKLASPLDRLPTTTCVKPVSFAHRLTITLDGHRTPDLACPLTDRRELRLKADVLAIAKALAVQDMPGQPVPNPAL